MDPKEHLSFFTTQELIAELMRRQTFMSAVLPTTEEARGQAWNSERTFKVQFNDNSDTMCTRRLLNAVAEHMNISPC